MTFHIAWIRATGMKTPSVKLLDDLCDRFLLAQDATGLSKKEFAAAVGLTSSKLTNIKNYRNPPSHESIYRAMVEFGFTADWFYTGSRIGFRDPGLAARLRASQQSRPAE
jgi:transcriptional regulator with XRE-family HTH domain